MNVYGEFDEKEFGYFGAIPIPPDWLVDGYGYDDETRNTIGLEVFIRPNDSLAQVIGYIEE
jgi:hypothetical protein